jgi:hypothetical protein
MGQAWLTCICVMGSSQGIIRVAGDSGHFDILSSTYLLLISYVYYHTTTFVLPCSHIFNRPSVLQV